MKQFFIKQKIFALKDQYKVYDEQQEMIYEVEGSFLKLPKKFTIKDAYGNEIAEITRELFSILPKFKVAIVGFEPVEIKKKFTFINSTYSVSSDEITVKGEWLDFNFEVEKNNEIIGRVTPAILSWGDTYEITVLDESYEQLLVALTVAIDCAASDSSILLDAIPFID